MSFNTRGAGAPRRSSSLVAAFALAGCLALTGGPSFGDSLADKTDQFLQLSSAKARQAGWVNVILKLDKLTPEHEQALRALGCDITRHLPLIESLGARVPNRSLRQLADLPFVKRLSADVNVKKNDEFIVQTSYADVAYSQYKLTGYGVGVAVIDSGVLDNKDLWDSGKTRISAKQNFVAGTTVTDDKLGHGTHVAGIIGGNGTLSTGTNYYRTFYGIARRAKIINLRVLDTFGAGTVSGVVSAIQWAVKNKSAQNIRVINLSLGHDVGESYTTDPLCQACEAAWKAGIVVVCAAGNNGRLNATQSVGLANEGYGTAYGTIESPGNDPYVITVGATKAETTGRTDDQIGTYSGRGPSRLDFVLKPDIIAPGNRVISTNAALSYLPNTYGATNLVPWTVFAKTYNSADSSKYFLLSGTSMATPVVSGAVALLLEKYPTLTPDTVKARLMATADKWAAPDGTCDACTYGAGYLNIPAALASTIVPKIPAQSPKLYRDANGNVMISQDASIWNNNALWGTTITQLNAIWGTNAIWGNTTLSSSNAIWGTSVWTNNTITSLTAAAADTSAKVINGED